MTAGATSARWRGKAGEGFMSGGTAATAGGPSWTALCVGGVEAWRGISCYVLDMDQWSVA